MVDIAWQRGGINTLITQQSGGSEGRATCHPCGHSRSTIEFASLVVPAYSESQRCESAEPSHPRCRRSGLAEPGEQSVPIPLLGPGKTQQVSRVEESVVDLMTGRIQVFPISMAASRPPSARIVLKSEILRGTNQMFNVPVEVFTEDRRAIRRPDCRGL